MNFASWWHRLLLCLVAGFNSTLPMSVTLVDPSEQGLLIPARLKPNLPGFFIALES
jgi:hypothetical protein